MEVKLQASDGTTRSVQMQAMDTTGSISDIASTTVRVDRGASDPALVAQEQQLRRRERRAREHREKRNGDPLSSVARELENPRKRARSASPHNKTDLEEWKVRDYSIFDRSQILNMHLIIERESKRGKAKKYRD